MLYKTKTDHFNKEPIVAIHSVFILKENILFLEQWIDYHIQLGVDKFYLYDNSKVTKLSNWDYNNFNDTIILGKVNKHNVSYDKLVMLSNKHLQNKFNEIKKKYKKYLIVKEWSPKDKNGNILHNQTQAHNECLKIMKTDGVDWGINIDMDEFITIKEGKEKNIKKYIKELDNKICGVNMNQIRFSSRFNNLDKLVIDIKKSEQIKNNEFIISESKPYYNDQRKVIYKVDKTTELIGQHKCKCKGIIHTEKHEEINFNHYKLNEKKSKYIHKLNHLNKIATSTYSNINNTIKDKIKKNSKNYIIIN